MIAFVLRRLLLMVPTTLGIVLVVFAIYHAAPGDPATAMMGAGSGGQMGQNSDTESRVDAFRREFGLDRSYLVQYLNYIGPFNLMRDGHPWFSSPYTERKVEDEDLPSGGEVALGRPLPIDPLPGTPEELADELDAAAETVATTTDDGARAAAIEKLRAAKERGYPALFTALNARYRKLGDAPLEQVRRLSSALASITGAEIVVEPEVAATFGERESLVRLWFAWYYTKGGGYRVRNTGEHKWGGLLALDLGKEMQTKRSVVEELGRRLAVTVPLSLASVVLSYLIALPLGIFSARRQGRRVDTVVTVVLFILYSIPTFWAGLMLILLFGRTGLDWLPVLGLHDKDAESFTTWQYVWDTILHTILPVATLTYGSLAYLSRQMRAGMLDVIRQDYIRTARAKGLAENVVVYKHALRNSMIPVITLLASILPILIGGSIIVEAVFDIQGMGKYAFEGLQNRDFYVVMATTTFVGIMTQFGILLSDITYSIVDPRIRHT
ncbi:MAG: ABC transporter permease [Planctomycetota bacterium]